MSTPAVSVILPVYNRATTLQQCVATVLAQTFSDWELVAVDDASKDESCAVIEGFKDPRIRLVRHEQNKGPSGARNTGIQAARGKYIALLDSDDEWLPGKLAAQVALLESGACDLCGCNYLVVNGDREHLIFIQNPASWEECLHTRCELGNGTTLVVRREVIDAIGLLDETFRFYEDWDWVLRMAAQFRLLVVPEPLARVYSPATRPAAPVALAAEAFLRKHEHRFQKRGPAYTRAVRAKHYENVAANAFAQRSFGLGAKYLLKSLRVSPCQNPLRLAALFLAPIDAAFGTSLIQRGVELRQRFSVSAS
jgi:cellulose synthase/poly-beta-1,6-N-acetylglucosamine synthase-like glycosyltransferase